ncbi:D-aminoacyl-tRNA deacylase 2 [Patella vulgata]|uniref:D-aminoacyl-tRNA deacylase 2 n=1 Tax=Patella vulgata TaxID=6465 RepID=UPI0024A9E505|nr:D-aminoacyl-tRNA deacylase 2 [Patella vulgata]
MAVATMAKSKVVLQQCLSARLQIQPETDETPAKHVEIKRGLVVYVCFLKDATEDILDKMVKSVLTARLSEGRDEKLVSILDLPGDVLIIPQATLGGILKGKMMQYHKNIDKETGLKLYTKFVEMCEQNLTENSKIKGVDVCVKSGTYGNRQVFSCSTNGPYSHIIEF